MSIERDALFTAYALGEIEGAEKEAIEKELAASPEKQAWVEEVRELAGWLEDELTFPTDEEARDDSLALTDEQRASIDAQLGMVEEQELVEGEGIAALTSQTNTTTEPEIGEPPTADPDRPLSTDDSEEAKGSSWPMVLTFASLFAFIGVIGGGQVFMMQGAKAPSSPTARRSIVMQKPSYAPRQPIPSFQQPQTNQPHALLRQEKPRHNAPVEKVLTKKPNKADPWSAASTTITKKEQKNDNEAKGKKKNKKQRAQVWKRTRQNTILSRVSVGGSHYLVLKKMRITVQIEGLRARTVIDHIYYNPYHRTLQGTFKYTLPPRSSVSYYAMFVGTRQRRPRFFGRKIAARTLLNMPLPKMARQVPRTDWGKLREARLVAAVKGRQTYERITRRRIDPALLEQDAPNTFKGRVFPIPARGYNRVIIAYEQTLPQLGAQQVYRFRFPKQVADSIDFTIEYDKSLAALKRSNLRKIRCKAPQTANFMRCYWEHNKPDRDAIFYFQPKRKDISWVAGVDPVDQKKYVMGRMRISLPTSKDGYSASHGLFALDTSLSSNPDLFATHVRLLMNILSRNQKSMKRFNVLLFDAHARWYNPRGWLTNDAATRSLLQQRLRKIVLEGATSAETALKALAKPSWEIKKGRSVDIFVLSDGQLNWGNTQPGQLLASFRKHHRYGQVRFFAYQTGIGGENASFGMRLAREGGAFFSCLGRAELPRCAVAHTKPAMQLKQLQLTGVGASETLVEGRQVSLYPGALLSFASRIQYMGQATLVLKGHYQGKPITITRKMRLSDRGELAPRAWAELAVAQLTELNHPKLTPLIVAYSQHFRIPNKHCSFLVLETDKEYKQYGLNKQKRQQRVADVAQWIERWYKQHGTQRSAKTRWQALLRRAAKRAGVLRQSAGRTIFSILRRLPESSFVFPTSRSNKIWYRRNVTKRYMARRLLDRNQFDPFVKEAKRRLRSHVAGAVRALSSIVELHPGNPQALRLVGYYLTGWQRPGEAGPIFMRVLERRPYEPHSYRDLARSLVQLGRYPLAAALYEIILARRWSSRFGDIKTIAREEYALLLHQALYTNKEPMKPSLRALLNRRKSLLGLHVRRSKLRVTVTWNTNDTDIDLWVTEPSGEKCYYRNRRTRNGGALLQDITRGYGPERYQNIGGSHGYYKIQLNYFGHNTNLLGNETHAAVTIVRNAGTPQQEILERSIVLKRNKQTVTVMSIKP